jgi:hypothetical protein
MSDQQRKVLPSEFSLTLSNKRSMPALRLPEVQQPYAGREGRRLANEMRARYFRLWHYMIIQRLAVESTVALNDYAMLVIDQTISKMLDRLYGTERRPMAAAFMQELTQTLIQDMVATIRAILEDHVRRMGEII